ncbi:hypothetical protein SPAR62_1556 [Streptococcus pneumoniae GA40028]|nr:hypothetical protein SPAR62_1556 [Streptococcus pneumoniae GA40028]
MKLKERISKYLVTNDQRRYCRYSDSDILVQFLFQLLTGYGTDYACKELSADAYFPKLLEGGQLASQPTLSRFLSRTDEETVHSLRCLNLELVEFFLQFHQLNQLIVDIDSTHFTTYGKSRRCLLITPTIVLMAIILFMLSRGRQVIVSMPSFVLVIVIVLKRQTALSHLF